ncbi:hypothetical protein WEU38_11925 [Cyanobacterium aponinum AL20118]|uniref:Uncharacterized protein n=1 Tax=Cyanobacterium aponinum AL20115 TaxID=3090662 RepID=A0AAF1C5P0_9CHRO|nr:hypothetical protein [Cyanobacterium aponinum]WPF87519.1 hypothetical protein SAY89_11960 [Cyanobacterium aponinum AL20115]
MNNNIYTSLTIHNRSQCSYTTAEFTSLQDVYNQALQNPELIYKIDVHQDFTEILFQVTNRIAINIEVIHTFDDYNLAKKYALDTNGTLTEIPEAWSVAWMDLTDETQDDYFVEEFDNYSEALKEYNFWKPYEDQGLASVLIKPIFK